MKSWRSHLLIACAASTATAIVVGGIAFATIPNNLNGSISACYKTNPPNKGQVRIIDHQAGRACRSGESMLTWPSHAFRWRGAWNGAVAYKINDVVSLDGSSYIATAPTTNVFPLSTGYWSLMTAAGAPGGGGGAGATGPTGPAGTTGPSGVAQCGGYPHTGIDWSVPGSTAGNGCDLSGALLTNQVLNMANLTNANFTNANLAGANLTAANFTGANLTGATLTGATGMGSATLVGVTWSATTCPDGTLSSASNPETCVGHT